LVDSLGLAGVTGDSYSLVEMQSGPSANNFAFIEYDLAVINSDHGPELVIGELLPAVFHVFRESDPVADCQRDVLSLEHTELSCLVEWQLLFDAILSDKDSSLHRPRPLRLISDHNCERMARSRKCIKVQTRRLFQQNRLEAALLSWVHGTAQII
jgi:hypothetical protein